MKKLFLSACIIFSLSGCATSSLLDSPSQTTTQKSTPKLLVEDNVVAFGRRAQSSMPEGNDIVIVGEQHSYVLYQGAHQLINLITSLNPKNFSVENQLDFVSDNDGKFSGVMQLSYVSLKEKISRSDLEKLLQNGAKECSSSSDEKINAQRFCVKINIQGNVYPRVRNYDLVKSNFTPLTRPYQVRIYKNTTTTTSSGKSSADKLVLLPFALAFDVVTLPVQVLGALAN